MATDLSCVEPFCIRADMWIAHLRNADDPSSRDKVMLVLNAVDDCDVYWGITNIEGWWTTPEPDIPDQRRGWGDGSYLDTGRYEQRVFTINGFYRPLNMVEGAAAAARDRLIRAIDLVRKQGVLVSKDWDAEKFSVIELGSAPLINTLDESGMTEFSLQFRAPDPRKLSTFTETKLMYGDLLPDPNRWTYLDVLQAFDPAYSTIPKPAGPYDTYQDVLNWGGSQAPDDKYSTVRSRGNYNADLAMTVSGLNIASISASNPVVITNLSTGQKVKIIKNPAGKDLTIDTTLRDVRLSTQWGNRNYLALDSDWMYLATDVNLFSVVPNIAAISKAQIRMSWRDTWIG